MNNLPFTHICIINLKKNKDRLRTCILQLKKHNLIGSKCVEGVDGFSYVPYGNHIKTLKKKSDKKRKYTNLMRKTLKKKGLLEDSYRSLRIGEIGCLQSFIKTFKKLLTMKHQNVLILEDDFKLDEKFRDKLMKVKSHIPKDADVVYLGVTPMNYKYGKFTSKNKYFYRPHGASDKKYKKESHGAIYGNHGFIINKKAMKAFVDHSMPMKYAADVLLGKLSTQNKLIKAYNLKNDLITTFKKGSNTM